MLLVSHVIVKSISRLVLARTTRRLMLLTCSQREQQAVREKTLEAEQEKSSHNDSSPASKSARAYATTYTSGPPLVPALVVDSVMQYITKINVRRKLEFVLLVCKYWGLKREARRGAPLLKRLHLEPWTASNSGGGSSSSQEDNLQKLNVSIHLLNSLVPLSLCFLVFESSPSRSRKATDHR